jgi:hypothetical protein
VDPGSIRKLGATAAALLFVTAALAVDVNKATQADPESVKGIGPAVSTQILAEREKASSRTGTTSSCASRASAQAAPPGSRRPG